MLDGIKAVPEMMTASQAGNMGTNTSNLYIDIAKKGTGTLSGDTVDAELVSAKVDRLLAFSERMVREVNSSAENTIFSAGEIDASWVYIEILRTQASIECQNAFYQANSIGPIVIYRTDVMNGKITITEKITYTNCLITGFEANAVALEGKKLDTLKVWFRYTKRDDQILFFDQTQQPKGNMMSTIDFTKGELKAAGPA